MLEVPKDTAMYLHFIPLFPADLAPYHMAIQESDGLALRSRPHLPETATF